MERISKIQKEERLEQIPEILRDAIFADEGDEVIYSFVEKYQLTEIQQKKVARMCLYVFLGFLRIKDVFEELTQDVKLDSKTALAVYQELEQKVFGPYKVQIEENYRAFQTTPQDIAFPKTQEQIVLKNPIEEGAVNLKTENKISKTQNVPVAPQNVNGSIPVALDKLAPNVHQSTEESGVSERQNTQAGIARNPFTNPAIIQQKSEIKPSAIGVDSSLITNHKPLTTSDSAPFILHKHEDAIPIAQSQAQKGYKQMSFGSFSGAFRAPQAKQQEVSHARVEIPGIPVSAPDIEPISAVMQKNTPTQVPFLVKKYETPIQTQTTKQGEVAKVVHYTSDGEK